MQLALASVCVWLLACLIGWTTANCPAETFRIVGHFDALLSTPCKTKTVREACDGYLSGTTTAADGHCYPNPISPHHTPICCGRATSYTPPITGATSHYSPLFSAHSAQTPLTGSSAASDGLDPHLPDVHAADFPEVPALNAAQQQAYAQHHQQPQHNLQNAPHSALSYGSGGYDGMGGYFGTHAGGSHDHNPILQPSPSRSSQRRSQQNSANSMMPLPTGYTHNSAGSPMSPAWPQSGLHPHPQQLFLPVDPSHPPAQRSAPAPRTSHRPSDIRIPNPDEAHHYAPSSATLAGEPPNPRLAAGRRQVGGVEGARTRGPAWAHERERERRAREKKEHEERIKLQKENRDKRWEDRDKRRDPSGSNGNGRRR